MESLEVIAVNDTVSAERVDRIMNMLQSKGLRVGVMDDKPVVAFDGRVYILQRNAIVVYDYFEYMHEVRTGNVTLSS
jgi:hypothetical protein